ncbi:hypothetical protein KSB_42840 [Ktedonobacter robiniae]|uniref:DUF5652 domain-containing protein n=1 Tax=Ktedonobacter robiniae TaxID=2778365 RepID=A0ABQ3USU4_9CHLR|nr:hypothetical protein KSB_42840 [Ktedonobacter robiniae]
MALRRDPIQSVRDETVGLGELALDVGTLFVKEFFVKTNGLRWICMMLLAPVPWAQRVWALPFLTVCVGKKASDEQTE